MNEESSEQANPIPVILHCHYCKKQHVDEGIWATRPHRTHQCVDDVAGKGCGKAFTSSTFRTVGVLVLPKEGFAALREPPRCGRKSACLGCPDCKPPPKASAR